MKDLEGQITDSQPRYLYVRAISLIVAVVLRNPDLQEQFLLHMGTLKNCIPANISQTPPGHPGVDKKKDLEIPENTKEQAMVMGCFHKILRRKSLFISVLNRIRFIGHRFLAFALISVSPHNLLEQVYCYPCLK